MQASHASSSIQDPSDPSVLPAVEPIALRQIDIEVDDGSPLEMHTEFPDVPYERLDLPRVCESLDETYERSDLPGVSESAPELADGTSIANENAEEELPVAIRPPPEWCVDQGETIVAMTTFELWMALARGEVDSQTRVWGHGMDNWEIVNDVPELSYALADSLSLAPPPVHPTPSRLFTVRGQDRTPLGFGTTDAANDAEEGPAQSGPISRQKRQFLFNRVAMVVGGFAAAAVVALTAVPQTELSASAAGPQKPAAVARLRGAMERANRQVDAAAHRWLESEAARAVEPVVPVARQHKELGQRRVRRGRH